jgi:hypothetical protein
VAEKKQVEVKLGDVLKETGNFVKEMFPGLSLSKFLDDIKVELTEKWDQGRQELAAALMRGYEGFVLYQHSDKDRDNQPAHGLPKEVQKEQERGLER